MMKISAVRIAVTATMLAAASTAGAQQADAKTLSTPAVHADACKELVWQQALLARYPDIAAACQEVVVSNDTKFARFTGEFVKLNRDGTFEMAFKNRAGGTLGRTTLQPAPNQRVLIDGRQYRFSDLEAGQQLNLYVPESRLVIATDPSAPPESMAKIILDQPASDAQPVRVAEATPVAAATAAPARLPDTAGWSPLLVLAGVLTMLGALTLTMYRRFRKPAMGPATI
jgi:hypothetical protein